LQAKRNVRNFPIIFRNADEARVRQKAKPLKQLLRHSKLKVRADGRTQRAERIVASKVSIVESDQQVGAGVKSLLVGNIRDAGVVVGHGPSAQCAAGEYKSAV